MANYAVYVTTVNIAGDGSSTSYAFNPGNGSGILGLPTNSPAAVLEAVVLSGPTSPTITSTSILLGEITVNFSAALQAVNANVNNLYAVQFHLGY